MPCKYSINNEEHECPYGLPDEELVPFDGGLKCKYHLPIIDKNGQKTKKGCWDTVEVEDFNNEVMQLIARVYLHSGEVILSGVIFPGNIIFDSTIKGQNVWGHGVDFQGAEFFGNVHFKKIPFKNNFLALNTLFHFDVIFDECNFYGNGKFDHMRVIGNAAFPKVVFHQECSFLKIRFESNTIFTSGQFKDTLNFEGSIFGEELEEGDKVTHEEGLNFSNARIIGKNDFSSCKFFCNSDFSGCNFGADSIFSNCVFGRDKDSDARFYKTTFSRALFDGSVFKGIASFQNGVLGGEFSFVGVEVENNAIFIETNFSSFSNFNECLFKEDALFQWARFMSLINLDNGKISGSLNFFEAKFKGGFRAENINVGGVASFDRRVKEEESNESKDEMGFKYIKFKGSYFGGPVSFDNRKFFSSADFSYCTFVKAPRFFECELHQDTKFPSEKYFLDHSGKAGPSYRKLKLEMEIIRARQEEGMFNALEQKCQIADPSLPKMDKILSRAYDIFAGYGQSLTKPIGWMGGILVSFFGLYILMAKNLNFKSPDCLIYLVKIFGFVIEQMVSPFRIWKMDKIPVWFCECVDIVFLKLAATMQSMLFIAFFALFILSLRWRFKRG